MRALVRLILALLLCVSMPLEALAAGEASTAFEEARELYDAKRFDEALPKFEVALEDSRSPNARFYVARCLRELGRLAEAHRQMQLTVRDARDKARDDEYYAQTRDAAAAELALLDDRVGKLVVVLDDDMSGATVRVVGRELASDEIGVPVAVLPGDVVVEATTADGTSQRRVMTIEASATKTITFSQPQGGPTPSGASTSGVSSSGGASETGEGDDGDADDGAGFGVVRGIGIGVAAVGVAGLVMFGVFNAQADSKLETLETECGGTRCTDPAYADVIDDGKRAETFATASLVVGIAAALGGTAMIIFGGPGDEADGVAMVPVLVPAPGGGVVGVVGRF